MLSRRNIIIISLLIILVITGAVFYLLKAKSPSSGDSSPIVSGDNSLFPSGAPREVVLPGGSLQNLTSFNDQTNSGTGNLNSFGNFVEISNTPVSGIAMATIHGSTSPIYLEKTTGNIFQVDLINDKTVRLTNTTFPGVYQTYWGQDKNSPRLIMQYINGGVTQNLSAYMQFPTTTLMASSTIATTTNTIGRLAGTSIDPTLFAFTVSPKADKIFTLKPYAGGVLGYTSDFNLKNTKQVFSSPLVEWAASWPEANTILLWSKPSSDTKGVLYALDLKTNKTKLVLSNLAGLSVLGSPDGKKVLLSTNEGMMNMYILDLAKNSTILAGISTLADKCVWTTDSKAVYCGVPDVILTGAYPENWYKGLINFSDSLWKVDASTGRTEQVFNPKTAYNQAKIDAVNLLLDKNNAHLFVTNKTDNTLWMLKLNDLNQFPVSTSTSSTASSSKGK